MDRKLINLQQISLSYRLLRKGWAIGHIAKTQRQLTLSRKYFATADITPRVTSHYNTRKDSSLIWDSTFQNQHGLTIN
ncbi:Protein of unknown function [Pyronema omphalodes CBS 100304]|uniref:Uncharacterized protein n=1 Tax=Pyronema omphalodes (strain CBS 100304) TaxID=1076935 RepID=U4L6Y7_PYROM|nr:Protein of unknown function [Pyronema omphalodes CBS 100304]